jgi:general secretion pathway protein D
LTPQISEGDTVRLLLFEEVSDLVPTSQVEVLQLGPTTTVRSATTSVVVKDSQTVAIGGLISDKLTTSQQSVPFLSDIPVIGNFFKFDDKDKEKMNLIILLTPRLLRNPTALTALTEGERERFHKAVTGRKVFSGTMGKIDPPPPPPPEPLRAVHSGVLLPAENGGGAAAHGDNGVLLSPEGGNSAPPVMQ